MDHRIKSRPIILNTETLRYQVESKVIIVAYNTTVLLTFGTGRLKLIEYVVSTAGQEAYLLFSTAGQDIRLFLPNSGQEIIY